MAASRTAATMLIGMLAAFVALSVLSASPEAIRVAAQGSQPNQCATSAAFQHVATWAMPPRNFVPLDLALGPSGRLYVADKTRRNVYVYDKDGWLVDVWTPIIGPNGEARTPQWLAVDPSSGRVYVAWIWRLSYSSPWVVTLQTRDGISGRVVAEQTLPALVRSLVDIDLSTADELLVFGGSTVHRLHIPGKSLTASVYAGPQSTDANRVAAMADGGYALSVPSLKTVFIYDSEGLRRASIEVPGEPPVAVGATGGELFVLLGHEAPPGPDPQPSPTPASPPGPFPVVAVYDMALQRTKVYSNADLGFAGVEDLIRGGIIAPAYDGFAATVGELATVTWFDAEGRTLTVLSSGSSYAWDIGSLSLAAAPDGGAFAAYGGSTQLDIHQFSPEGHSRTVYPYGAADVATLDGTAAFISPWDGSGDLRRLHSDGSVESLGLACDCALGGRLAVSGDEIYVSRPRQRSIAVFDSSAMTVSRTIELSGAVTLWPTDITTGPDGALYAANQALGEVMVWPPAAAPRVLWASSSPGLGPARIDAGYLAGGVAIVAALVTDGAVEIRTAGDGSLLTSWRPEIGDGAPLAADDVSVGPNGRLYLTDSGSRAVHIFELSGELPTPPPEPPATATPVGLTCAIQRDKRAGPRQLVLGESASVTLTLSADCPVPAGTIGADLILVMNHGAQDSRGRTESYPGEALEIGRKIAAAIVTNLDFRYHQVGLVTWSVQGDVTVPLTTDVNHLLDEIAAVQPTRRFTRLSEALGRADQSLSEGGRDRALPAIVVIGSAGTAPRWPDDQLMPVASELRNRGVQIFALTFTPPDYRFPEPTDWLRELTGSADRHRHLAGPQEAPLAIRAILLVLEDVAGRSLAGSLLITDSMAKDIQLVPGSGKPPAEEGPGWLSWHRSLLPASGITLTYRIVPQRLGILPTNLLAVADYTDVDGQRRWVEFPVPEIEVVRPPFTPTPAIPTATPTPVRRPVPLYLPVLIRQHCITERLKLDVALVIDSSSSMAQLTSQGRAKLEAALDAVEGFLWLLDLPQDRAAIVEFNYDARVIQSLTGSRSDLLRAIRQVEIAKGTRLHLGIAAARELLPNGSDDWRRAPVLVLLTDGRSDPDPVSLAIAEAARAKAEGVAVFTIGLGDDVDADALRIIASHPAYYYQTPDAEDLNEVYLAVAQQLPCP